MIFTIFGLDNGMIKYVARYNSKNQKENLYELVRIAFAYSLVFSIVGSIITFIFRRYIGMIFNDELLTASLIIGAWVIIPRTLNRLFGGLYKGFKKIKYFVLGNEIFRRMLMFLMLLMFVAFDKTELNVVITVLLASTIIITIFFFFESKNFNVNLKNIFTDIVKLKRNDKNIKKRLISYSSTMILISFMNVILGRTDRVMIGIFSTAASVGIYNIAATIGGLSTFLLVSSNMTFAPIISELYSQNKLEVLNDLYSTITKWIVMFTTPIIISIIVYPETILNVFGSEYIAAKYVLILIALGQMINAFVGANGYILNMSGHEKLTLINNFIMASINIILNILLIPRFDILGAAMATTISIIVINIAKVIQVKKYLDIFPYNKKFLVVILGILSNCFIAGFFKLYFNNLFSVIIITIINILLSIFLLLIHKDELDSLVFTKLKDKVKNLKLR
jgi:O-antigen/teichoic acid export membrane protein